ncbi:hydrolase [Ammoniphilus oxalaticus]|uniref:Hydrolase n=2 Tax=Ammoniphilus oxalaticus TaxID=66863 RepID=A0A419SKW8_9BACL|nr:hydrolase [Ammoniphilus oxalaticus]
MITIDVDDTLLNDAGIVTEGTKQAIMQAMERGVKVTLATGRMYASAVQVAQQMGLNVPLITYQGSLVKNLIDGETLYERFVPQEITELLFDYADKHQLHLQGYFQDRLYGTEDNDKIKRYASIAKVPYTIEDAAFLRAKPLTKLLFFEEPDVLEIHEQHFKKVFGDRVYITRSKPFFLEVLHRDATKGHAVRFLAERSGCSMSDVIAIGDSWNDHEMIEAAGLGVAMDNAIDSLKAIADYITRSNNDDGVKHVIEKFILK